MPTDRLLRMVESNDTSTHFVASASAVRWVMTRSMIGLPYFGFTGLKVGRIDSRLDEIALRIDSEEPQRLASDLPADDE